MALELAAWIGGLAYVGSFLWSAARGGGAGPGKRADSTLVPIAGRIGFIVAAAAVGLAGSYSAEWFVLVPGALLATLIVAWPALGLRAEHRDDRLSAVLILALIGAPPFPGFWARWQIVNALPATGRTALLAVIVVGGVAEAVHGLGRASAAAGYRGSDRSAAGTVGAAAALLLLAGAGVFTAWFLGLNDRFIAVPLLAGALVLAASRTPRVVRAGLSVALIGFYGWLLAPLPAVLPLVYALAVLALGVATVVTALARGERPPGGFAVWSLAVTAFAGLAIAAEPMAFVTLAGIGTVCCAFMAPSAAREEPRGNHVPGRLLSGQLMVKLALPLAAALLTVGFALAAQARLASEGGAVVRSGNDGGERPGPTLVALPQLFGADGYALLPVVGVTRGYPADGVRAWFAPGGRPLAARVPPQPEADWSAGAPVDVRIAFGALIAAAAAVQLLWASSRLWTAAGRGQGMSAPPPRNAGAARRSRQAALLAALPAALIALVLRAMLTAG